PRKWVGGPGPARHNHLLSPTLVPPWCHPALCVYTGPLRRGSKARLGSKDAITPVDVVAARSRTASPHHSGSSSLIGGVDASTTGCPHRGLWEASKPRSSCLLQVTISPAWSASVTVRSEPSGAMT